MVKVGNLELVVNDSTLLNTPGFYGSYLQVELNINEWSLHTVLHPKLSYMEFEEYYMVCIGLIRHEVNIMDLENLIFDRLLLLLLEGLIPTALEESVYKKLEIEYIGGI